jgi:hypothetical protein
MAGRSYLRRIAQPLIPGAPMLVPLRVPPLEDARPPVMQTTPGGGMRRQSFEAHQAPAPPDASADPARMVRRQAAVTTPPPGAPAGRTNPAAPVVTAASIGEFGVAAPEPLELPDLVAPADRVAAARPQEPQFPEIGAADRSDRAAPPPATSPRSRTLAVWDDVEGEPRSIAESSSTDTPPALMRPWTPPHAQAATGRPILQIGTIEVRVRQAPAPPATPPPAPAAAPAPPAPLSRSLAWRYGLLQS